ncbi:beta galactosidase jelly roll domain-containing protein [Chloroflexi bacterium TSY]|nr:beta galactosidase jelly roll domain-containing protein [Chloroflexi bacterium TSY]
MSFRTRIELDGIWDFQMISSSAMTRDSISTNAGASTSISSTIEIEEWRQAQVPQPWQAQFDDLRYASGGAWYRRNVELASKPNESAILHFGAVDYLATVWVNGQKVGSHEGGYLPFEFEVGHLLHVGQNEIAVYVYDPVAGDYTHCNSPFGEIPHGKQSWYGPISGIWQSVWLELRPQHHLVQMRLTPLPLDEALDISVILNQTTMNVSDASSEQQIAIQVQDPNGVEVASGILNAQGEGRIQMNGVPIERWSPDSPALYVVTATLLIGGQPVDELRDTCGFRTIEARDGRIYLNGEPVYLRGVLDQAYYPETIYTPPSIEFLEDQVRKAKALGLNCLRTHIKIEDPRYYEVADRLGILIWTEIPNWHQLTPDASIRVKETFAEMVDRDWNHPSIFT